MQKFSSKLLPIIVLVYLISINQIDCSGRWNRGPPKLGTPHRGPPHRGPPKCGLSHRDAPRRPPPNRCYQDNQKQTIIDSTFVYESGTIKPGDQLQCKLVNVTLVNNSSRSRCDEHIFTQAADDPHALTFVPVSNNSKCFSFQVRSNNSTIHIHFSNTPVFQTVFEVVIYADGFTMITDKNYDTVVAVKTPVDITNNQNLLPFWVTYDNNFVKVGYGNSTVPYLSHQFKSQDGFPSPVNYIGILSESKPTEWVIDAEPICGTKNSTATPTQVKTVCKVKTGRPSRLK